ncbi:MAG: hypothetical protein ABW034_13050, partial [Steroidobacteraceae bacterium]
MKQLRNILVVVDPTRREQPGIRKAAQLARHFDARVQLFACDTPSSRETRLLNKHVPLDLSQLMEVMSEPLKSEGL